MLVQVLSPFGYWYNVQEYVRIHNGWNAELETSMKLIRVSSDILFIRRVRSTMIFFIFEPGTYGAPLVSTRRASYRPVIEGVS